MCSPTNTYDTIYMYYPDFPLDRHLSQCIFKCLLYSRNWRNILTESLQIALCAWTYVCIQFYLNGNKISYSTICSSPTQQCVVTLSMFISFLFMSTNYFNGLIAFHCMDLHYLTSLLLMTFRYLSLFCNYK